MVRMTSEEVLTILPRLFMLIGLDKQRWPDEDETINLVAYISSEIHLSIEDLDEAFKRLIKNEYVVDIKSYGKFSPAYIEDVISQFRQYRSKNPKKLDNYLMIPQKCNLSEYEKTNLLAKKTNEVFEQWKETGKIKDHLVSPIYEYLTESRKLILTDVQEDGYLEKAKFTTFPEETESFGKLVSEALNDYQKDLIIAAKKLAIIDYFKS